jgi:hypothetical protein
MTFETDTERRVLAHLRAPHDQDGAPFSDEEIVARVNADEHTEANGNDVVEVLKDLEARGLARQVKDGWKMTKAGFEELTA